MEHIVDNTTPIEAKSLSFPNCTAIIAPLVALGMDSKKNTVYLMALSIGKYATTNIVISDMTINFTTVAIGKIVEQSGV